MTAANVAETSRTWTLEERIAAQRKCVDLHVAIENAQQIERIIPETFAKQGIFYHLAPGVINFQGPEGVRDFYEMLFGVLPDIHITYSHEYDLPGYSIREGVVTGTHSAEFAGVPASGRKVVFPFCGIYIFDNADPTMLIAERAYWDNVNLMQQMRGEITVSAEMPWDHTK